MNKVPTAEQRAAPRFVATLPLEMEGMAGVTRDVSANGIYFETDRLQEIGPIVSVTLRYRQEGEWREAQCDARVVRVEVKGERVGIAARLITPFFEEAPGAAGSG